MKILLLAPEIVPPYTEGRKHFVIDLARVLSRLNHQVTLLTSGSTQTVPSGVNHTLVVPASTRFSLLVGPLTRLSTFIAESGPDVVVNFPHGTFSGLHFVPSRLYLTLADRICRLRTVPCFNVLYSMDRKTRPESLAPCIARLVTGHIENWHGPTLPFGRDFQDWPIRPAAAGSGRRLLFLAGMWRPTRAALDHVLRVRGLLYLLRAGKELSKTGVSLRVAIPLLASRRCQDWLLKHSENAWPPGTIRLSPEVTIPNVFHDADLFAFPYAEDITQFTPTSVVEAMLAGTPVVMSDLPFLRQLAGKGAATLIRPRDAESLTDSVLSLLADGPRLQEQAETAAEKARQSCSIEKSASALLAIIDQPESRLARAQ